VVGSRLGRRRKPRWPRLLLGASALGVLVAAGLHDNEKREAAPAAARLLVPDPDEVARRPLPDAGVVPDAAKLSLSTGPARTIEGKLARRERFIAVLDALALAREESYASIAAMEKVFDFRKLQPGTGYAVDLSSDGQLQGFRIYRTPMEVYEVVRGKDGFVGRRADIDIRRVVVDVAAEVRTSLWRAIRDAREDPALLGKIIRVFEWDVDFNSQTREGDRFAAVIEKVYVEDQFVEYGQLLGAAYEGSVAGSHRVVSWEEADGRVGYYDPDGDSVRRIFVKSPLQFTRISSGFSLERFHPILHKTRAHQGVDYAAPTGTPVRSIGDGYVIFAGYKGGNGKYVVLGHPNGIRSHYAHLSVIRRGVRYGVKVEQRQMIGRVGATGLATGPHLHFGLSKKGYYVNPLTFVPPPEKSIPEADKEAFLADTKPLLARLEASLQHVMSGMDWRP